MFSRCTKKNFYSSFKQVCHKFGRQDLLMADNYHKAKLMATNFQQAKNVMLKKFKDQKMRVWVSKPTEEEMFSQLRYYSFSTQIGWIVNSLQNFLIVYFYSGLLSTCLINFFSFSPNRWDLSLLTLIYKKLYLAFHRFIHVFNQE